MRRLIRWTLNPERLMKATEHWSNRVWVTGDKKSPTVRALARQYMGQEVSLIVWEIDQVPLDPDALAILSGCLIEAGALVLAGTPQGKASMYQEWLLMRLLSVECIEINPELSAFQKAPTKTIESSSRALTDQQAEVFKSLLKQYQAGKGCWSLVKGGRGRGKTFLALEYAQALEYRKKPVVMIAPQHRIRSLKALVYDWELSVRVVRPEHYQFNEADALLVDEAASVSMALLQSWVGKAYQVVMFTTTFGYEGQGSVLQNRLLQSLSCCELGELHELIAPVRWGEGDLLEACLNDVLFLGPHSALANSFPQADQISMEEVRPKDLIEVQSLSIIIGLLSSGHYRHKPSDVEALFETGSRLWLAKSRDEIFGVLWCRNEPSVPETLHEDILKGTRRLKSSLAVQRLAYEYSDTTWLRKAAIRVQRIVVAPHCRREGIASTLLSTCRKALEEDRKSILVASYAQSEALDSFWLKAGFIIAVTGVDIRANVGSPSNLVLDQSLFADSEALTVLHQRKELLESGLMPDEQAAQAILRVWLMKKCSIWLEGQAPYAHIQKALHALYLTTNLTPAVLSRFKNSILWLLASNPEVSWEVGLQRKKYANGKDALVDFKNDLGQWLQWEQNESNR